MSAELRKTAAGVLGLAAAALVSLTSGCLSLRDEASKPDPNPCTTCHGQARSGESPLLQSAPPQDTLGNTEVTYPGVGAHAVHLAGSETHEPIACEECHRVPEATDESGHADSAAPAELVFGELARGVRNSETGEDESTLSPSYDSETRRCADTYCHGAVSRAWTRPRDSEAACGSCHGLPPAPPHPQFSDCATCHGQVAGTGLTILAIDKHVNGRVEVDDPGCTSCHGGDEGPAPPRDLGGNDEVTTRGVGAHAAHLSGGEASRPLECEECHVVPDELVSDGHLDGSDRVSVTFEGVANSNGREPSWNAETATCSETWCHGATMPSDAPLWTNDSGPLACTSCHGMPPAAPHPTATNCDDCHETADAPDSIGEPLLHVDGQVQAEVPEDCGACHGGAGGENSAPPFDLSGEQDSTRLGVGAHQAHLVGRGLARPLECNECHVVPQATLEPGHIDTLLPAEVRFAGIAFAFEAEPSYADGTCTNTYCHGDSFIGKRPSGGKHTRPDWTLVDGSQVTCQSCHGMPPPDPHPQDADDCSECHQNIDADGTFNRPLMHVDGVVTFFQQ